MVIVIQKRSQVLPAGAEHQALNPIMADSDNKKEDNGGYGNNHGETTTEGQNETGVEGMSKTP